VSGIWTHIGLFLALSFAIVVMGAFYSEPEDAPALRSVPRRYVVFVAACAAVAGVMLALESLFASVR
jgi:hypothetical protein